MGRPQPIPPITLDERLERMARAADLACAEFHHRGERAEGRAYPGTATLQIFAAQLFLEIAGVLRAGIDPHQPLREEKINGGRLESEDR